MALGGGSLNAVAQLHAYRYLQLGESPANTRHLSHFSHSIATNVAGPVTFGNAGPARRTLAFVPNSVLWLYGWVEGFSRVGNRKITPP